MKQKIKTVVRTDAHCELDIIITNEDELIKYFTVVDCEVLELPNNVKTIKRQIFDYRGYEGIIKQSHEEIGLERDVSLFYEMLDELVIKKVLIPDSIDHIEEAAFCCAEIEEYEVSANCKCVKLIDDLLYSSDGTILLACPSKIKGDLKVPAFTRRIAENAFECSNISSIFIPEGVEEIGDDAFELCLKLQNIYLPKSIKKIGKRVFKRSYFLTFPNIYVYKNTYAHQYVIKNKVKHILID